MPLGPRKVSLTLRRTSKSGGVFYLVVVTPVFNILVFQNSVILKHTELQVFCDMFLKVGIIYTWGNASTEVWIL